MKRFFITASGTGVGKTLVTASLCAQLRGQGKRVVALKPVISGFEAGDGSDTAVIARSLGLAVSPEMVARISPWRFAAPVSPHLAAAREGRVIDVEELAGFCLAQGECDALLVEGVGGVMTPLGERYTGLDWMAALGWPVILVVGSYLGAMSHALSAFEAMRGRGIFVHAVVVSASDGDEVAPAETASTLESFLPITVSVVTLPRMEAREDIWKHSPNLTAMLGGSTF